MKLSSDEQIQLMAALSVRMDYLDRSCVFLESFDLDDSDAFLALEQYRKSFSIVSNLKDRLLRGDFSL